MAGSGEPALVVSLRLSSSARLIIVGAVKGLNGMVVTEVHPSTIDEQLGNNE